MTRDLETGLLWIQKGVQECTRLLSSHQLFNIQMTYMHHVCPCFHSSQKDLCLLKLQECPTLLGGSTCSPRPATATFGVGQDEIVVGGRHRGEAGNFSDNSTLVMVWNPWKDKTSQFFLYADGCKGNVYLFAVVAGGAISPVGFIPSKKRHWKSCHSGCGFKSLGLRPQIWSTTTFPNNGGINAFGATSPGVPDAGKTTLLREA